MLEANPSPIFGIHECHVSTQTKQIFEYSCIHVLVSHEPLHRNDPYAFYIMFEDQLVDAWFLPKFSDVFLRPCRNLKHDTKQSRQLVVVFICNPKRVGGQVEIEASDAADEAFAPVCFPTGKSWS